MLDPRELRREFPIFANNPDLVFLDSAASAQKPRAVIDALTHYYERDNANVHRGIHELSNRATNAFEAARARAAKFIDARSADEPHIDNEHDALASCALKSTAQRAGSASARRSRR